MSVFIYLLQRDKKNLKIITILDGSCPTKKITKVSDLSLPPKLSQLVENMVYENRMMWELWIETADTIHDLLASLAKRGIALFPIKCHPAIRLSDIDKDGSMSRTIDPIAMKRLENR